MAETRKLAAILAADVVGYSRLAGSDEERTLAPAGGGVHSRLECMLSGGSWVSLVIARHR
jgi:class 3 adenylate cyclase